MIINKKTTRYCFCCFSQLLACLELIPKTFYLRRESLMLDCGMDYVVYNTPGALLHSYQ